MTRGAATQSPWRVVVRAQTHLFTDARHVCHLSAVYRVARGYVGRRYQSAPHPTMAAIALARAPVFAPLVSALASRPRGAARACAVARPRATLTRAPGMGCPPVPSARPTAARARGAVRADAASALFQVAVPPPPLVIVPPSVAFMTCILAVLVIALLGRDEHGMLLAQIALNAPYAVTTWWLGETGHFVCFGILAMRTFFGAHLSGRLDALLNCFATLGLLIITAPNQAWVWRDTVYAAWLNVAICVYRLATHASSGDGGETGSRSRKAFIFFVAFVAKIGLLMLALPGIGLFNGFI